jgi:UrcA family protein
MKTPNIAVYAAPVALLVMACGMAAPNAAAEPNTAVRYVHTTFAYQRHAPAAQVYAELKKAVTRMCTMDGLQPSHVKRADDMCIATAMADGLSQIGRTDVAALHPAVNG